MTLPTVRFAARAELPDVRNVFTHMTLRSLTQSDSQEPDPRWLADPDATLAAALKSIPPGRDADGFPQPRALVFDQFEEPSPSMTSGGPIARPSWPRCGRRWTRSPSCASSLPCARSTWASSASTPAACRARAFTSSALRHDAAMRAVTGPLEGTGRTFGDGSPSGW